MAIIHSSIGNLPGISSVSDTSVKFDGMLHLGARIGAEQHFFFEIGLGILDDNFQFAPNIGWVF